MTHDSHSIKSFGSPRFWIAVSLVVSAAAHALGALLAQYNVGLYSNEPFHAFVETAGAIFGLGVAGLLLSMDRLNLGTTRNIPLVFGLGTMSLLDGCHAIVPPGQSFVWLHSAATFAGGLLFATVWVPPRLANKFGCGLLSAALIAVAIASMAFPEIAPAMVVDGQFTNVAVFLNIGGGALMLLAAARLLLFFAQSKNNDDLLFAVHCLLFGGAAIMFEMSRLWDFSWWWWHILRLVAYAVALSFAIQKILQLQLEVQRHTESLEAAFEQAKKEAIQSSAELIELSRQAGMAEVATDILHNVGNVLNSVNISAGVLMDSNHQSRVGNVRKVSTLLDQHQDDLPAFFAEHEIGKQLPRYVNMLGDHLVKEQENQAKELKDLTDKIDHIKQIVAMQQSVAKSVGASEQLDVVALVQDVIEIGLASSSNRGVKIVEELEKIEPITTEKHKVMQILINLLRNAAQSALAANANAATVWVKVVTDGENAIIKIVDNGVGIAAENLTKIFQHGFTTKKDGHGFGLHGSALAASELGGSLTAHSEGAGKGAEFTFRLPISAKTHQPIATQLTVMP